MANVDNPANYVFIDPGCNFTLYRAGGCSVRDTESFIQPKTENVNLLIGMTTKLSENWEVQVKGSMFQRESTNNRNGYANSPQAYNPAAFDGTTTLVNGVLTSRVGAIPDTTFAPGAQAGAGVTNPFAQNARLYGFVADTGPVRPPRTSRPPPASRPT